MKIKSGKTIIEVGVDDLKYTIRELKEELGEITNFTDIKLIHAGKVLRDDVMIGSIPGGFSAKLTMMGSTPTAIQSLEADKEKAKSQRTIDDLSDDAAILKRPLHSTAGVKQQYNPYKFESIQTLPNLPNEDKAREILTSLANDEGVLAVMKKHKWTVGALCELYPEGYVGVSDVCVMGLNENHGQRILLRLRTDDLKGFRKILSIRKVLCHELAHNVHSEHDSNFYVLMRQVESEIVELDWKNGKGRTLTGGPAPEQYTPSTTSSAPPSAHAGHILGGSTDPLVQQFIPARYLAGTAAIMRLSAEEQEVEDNCASGRPVLVRSASGGAEGGGEEGVVDSADGTIPTSKLIAPAPMLQSAMETGNALPRSEGTACAGTEQDFASASAISSDESLGTFRLEATEIEGTKGIGLDDGSTVMDVDASSELAPVAAASPPASIDFHEVSEAVLASIDDSVAFALSTESTAAPVEKLLALRDAVAALLDHFERQHSAEMMPSPPQGGSVAPVSSIAALLACLRVLHQVVANAKDHSDEKYRTVKKANKVFQRDVAGVVGAVQVLLCAGFADCGETLVLKRSDVGLLYVVAASLQNSIDIVCSRS